MKRGSRFLERGQVSLFVILAIAIVAVVIFVFAFSLGPRLVSGGEFNPQQVIDRCVKESLSDKLGTITIQGGFLEPTDYKLYRDVKATYLCKTSSDYEPCITQHPLYISEVKEEIRWLVKEDVENCFVILEEEMRSMNYEFSGGEVDVEIIFKQDRVEAKVYRDFSYSKNGESRSFDSVTTTMESPLYKLMMIASEITSSEATLCSFENIAYMALDKNIDIRKFTMSDSTKIYTIKDKATGKEMNIAIRGCVTPL